MPDEPNDLPPNPDPPPEGKGGVDAAGMSRDIHGGQVQDLLIEDNLKQSYLTYAMSVIVARALPDARDGLKPSQRRREWSMRMRTQTAP